MTDIQDGPIPLEENKVETLQDKITQNIDNLPQDNKNEFNNTYPYRCVGSPCIYCIPYNDDTKHILGTTEEAPEFYRYWED